MTKFKQGDRVVLERFDSIGLISFVSSMEQYINVEGIIDDIDERGACKVHGWWWPSSALRPASPKWEPVTGQEVEFYSINRSQWKKGIYYATIDGKHLIVANNNDPALIKDIRPIAPSPEEELRHKILESVGHASVCWGEAPKGIFDEKEANRCADDLFQFVMQWHNRHKEGEGR